MSEILCRWLNEEVGLSDYVDSSNFEQQLESGYLLGELLDRYELQTDFSRFRNEESSEAKLNNFKRLFPTFKLLQVPFDANTAQEVMAGKKGCANRLAYQLHTALNNVKRAGLSLGQQQVDTRKVRRNVVDERMYNDQLTRQVQRQTNLDQRELEETAELDRTVREDRWRSESLKEEAQMETIRAQNIKAAMERSKEVKRMRDERAKQIETMMTAKTEAFLNRMHKTEGQTVRTSVTEFVTEQQLDLPDRPRSTDRLKPLDLFSKSSTPGAGKADIVAEIRGRRVEWSTRARSVRSAGAAPCSARPTSCRLPRTRSAARCS